MKRASKRGGGGPTVADVAKFAGVSPMTVSRVVNGETTVTEATRTKVEAAISSLKYVPNLAARSLAGQGLCCIALLYDNPSAAFMTELVMGSLEAARSDNVQLLIEPYDPSESTEDLSERLRRHRVKGVLLPGLLCDDVALVSDLLSSGFSVGRIAAKTMIGEAHTVSIDDEAAAFAMTKHLIDLGHRRIGLITGPAKHPVSSFRLEGYRRALKEAGIAEAAEYIAAGDFSFRSGFDAAIRLLDSDQRPTAIFACNDDMAAATIAAAHRFHLDVPNDLSVCGFDDTAMATSVWPSLTTVRQPAAQMAGQALQMVAADIRERDRKSKSNCDERHVQNAFELIIRDSAAPPPG